MLLIGFFSYIPLVTDSPLRSAASGANLNDFLLVVFNYGIGIAVALAILFIIYGGILYMTTDAIFQKEEGRKRITAAVAGLLIALSGWLILNQINPNIFKNNLGLQELKGSNPGETGLRPVDDILTRPDDDGGEDGDTPPATGESPVVIGDEKNIRDKLLENNITINKNPCAYPGQKNCTNVSGFRQSTIDAINHVNNSTGGLGFVITGGTESGHAQGTYSHGNGYKFDIGKNSNDAQWDKIDSYFKSAIGNQNIENNKTYSFVVPSSGQRLDVRRETIGGLHWDIKALPY